MAKKFYAVRKGRTSGIYESWDEAKAQVDGFKGAEFKGFMTREEAESFMKVEGQAAVMKIAKSEQLAIPANIGEKGVAIAYVDGSYDRRKRVFSYGVVIIKDGNIYTENRRFIDDPLAEMHNVAGEIKGAEAAMRYALDHGYESIVIYHDYEGIAKWCLGEWVPKKPGTIAYKNYYNEVSQSVQISFVKVAAHTGDYYNEMADRLAKEALGIRK
jgi:ribonuclease HI